MGTYTTLDDPSAVGGTFGSGINDSGAVVGTFFEASGPYSSPVQEGFLYSGGAYTTLDDPMAMSGTFSPNGIRA